MIELLELRQVDYATDHEHRVRKGCMDKHLMYEKHGIAKTVANGQRSDITRTLRYIATTRFHVANFLLQTFVLHLTDNGIQLLQTQSFGVISYLNL